MTQRQQILRAVAAGHTTVEEVHAATGIQTAYLSAHLCLLRRVGFLLLVGHQKMTGLTRPRSIYRVSALGHQALQKYANGRFRLPSLRKPIRGYTERAAAPAVVERVEPRPPRPPVYRTYRVAGQLVEYEVVFDGA